MFARTKRLFLRPAWPEDAEALAAAIGHADVARLLAGVPSSYELADPRAFIALPQDLAAPHCVILAHDADGVHLAGAIALVAERGLLEFGCWITPSARGRGYAIEAGEAMIAYARHSLKVRRLHASHHRDHAAAAWVLNKLGFRPMGEAQRPSPEWRCNLASVQLVRDLEDDAAEDTALAA